MLVISNNSKTIQLFNNTKFNNNNKFKFHLKFNIKIIILLANIICRKTKINNVFKINRIITKTYSFNNQIIKKNTRI